MEDEEYKKLPLEDRCVHKLWKARVNGYEEVTKLFRQIDDEKSQEFGKYLGLVKKFVGDSNAMGQEKGLEATLAFVENYGHAGKTVGEVMSGIVTKCIAAPKTRTRELALQVTLMYIEIERIEAVQEELLKGMEHKNPKIVTACVNACTVALREFGSKVFPVKPLVKKISVLFADRDKNVRDEARQMVVEMYRWVGGALRPQLNNLQPVQLTELETEFSKVEGQKAIPQRFIRSEQRKQIIPVIAAEEVDGGASDAGEDDDDLPQIDPYELAEPVDILSKLPKDFYEKTEAKKWQERKEALEALETLVQTPKLQTGDYADLIRVLKKIIEKDSNVVVVALAGRCLGALAAGLKRRFQPYAAACISSLLEKFKEKKQNVVSAVKDAIDAIYLTTNLEVILEDVIEALGNKNPSVKAGTSMFLARSFSKTQPTVINKKMLKALTTGLVKNINEPDPTVRDCAADAIGTLMKLVGEKAISPFLVELEKDNLKMSKIKECCDKAVITVKISATKKERPTTAPAKSAPAKSVKSGIAAPRSAPSKAVPSKKRAESINTATVVRPKKQSLAKSSSAKTIERELGDEEVEELITSIISTSTNGELSDPNWKTRLAAAELFLKEIQSRESKEIPTQAIVRGLKAKPGLKDTNFQVLKAKIDIIKFLAENANFSITSANHCLSDLSEKFGDSKNGNLVSETMTAIAEATSLSFVSSYVIDYALNQKSPKVTQEVLNWLSNAIKEFGATDLNMKLFIENAKKALASTNPAVRQAAISFCGILYLYMGKILYTFFENEKPALRDQITVEFDKYEGMKVPVATRGLAKSSSAASNLDRDEEEAGTASSENNFKNVQDLLPRVDISNQITEALITELEDKNWKVRNEGLGKVNAIIQDAKFIKSNLGDLPQALSHRLSDSNTKIAQTALSICDSIAKAMGSPCKQYVKLFFPKFLTCLSDNKSWMRTAARETIDTYWEQCGHKEFFENEMIADALKTGSPLLRAEVWIWLSDVLPKVPLKSIPKDELVICIPHLYSNLEDRNADVRKNAQEAVLGIMIHLSYEFMVKHCEKLKPGSKSVIMGILDKVRPNLPIQALPKEPTERREKVVRGTKAVPNTKNVIKTKGAAVAATKSVIPKKKEDDIDTSPLLVVNNMKHQRTIDESKLKVLKWNFTTPREEFVELLRDQMSAANVNKTLIFNMFHNDFRFHIKALEALMDDLQDNGSALAANLDLILKWLTLRFFDTNPSVLLKGLEYLHLVFNMLTDTRYRMLENEAASFLPYVVLKIGDPKESVRNGVRSLFKQICQIYSASRLFTYIIEGLKSKNARQRAECLEALGSIIQDYGIEVCVPSPAACLKEVAKQISDRDNGVRNAALNCVVQAYNIVGERVYKMIGNMLDKDQSLLEERIRRSRLTAIIKPTKLDTTTVISQHYQPREETIQAEEEDNQQSRDSENSAEEDNDNLPPVVMPSAIIQETYEPTGPYRLDPDLLNELDQMQARIPTLAIKTFNLSFLDSDVNIPTLSAADIRSKILPLSPPKPLDPNMSLTRLNLSGQKQPVPINQNPMLISYINQIASTDASTAIQGIENVTDFMNSPRSAIVVDYENELIRSLTTQLKYLRNQSPQADATVLKTYRSILTVLDAIYHNKIFGWKVSLETLKDLMDQLIIILVDGNLEKCNNGSVYVKVTNLLCVKVIEKCDHTKIICALIQLLQECIRMDNFGRQTELVMKCLWRVIKQLPTWGDEIDYDLILLAVHNFLKEFPSTWWRNKPSDTALRTMKTILHSSVKIKGGSIMLHLGQISNTSESEVESYIIKLLKTMNLEAVKTTPQPPQRVTFSRAIHTMLTEIFQKIGNKNETQEGLKLLYDFLQQHPEADIDPFLKNTSKFFQSYIQNGLQEIEENRKKVAESNQTSEVSANSSNNVLNQSFDKSPEYWEQRLSKWKKSFEYFNDGD